MNSSTTTRRLAAGGLILSLTILPGCVIVSGSSTETVSGTPISHSTLAKVIPGETTKDWVLATLGPPTARTPFEYNGDPAGGEVFRYAWSREMDSHGGLLFIFSSSTRKTIEDRHYIEFHGDTVSRVWSEKTD